MINYTLRFAVSEVAELFGVEKKQIKEWAFHFSEYLNPLANPEKGNEREFTAEDICVLGYVLMYWEENPDFENIKQGLNSSNQLEFPFSDLLTQSTPIFREFSEELLDGKVWMIGGAAVLNELLSLADSYKRAGDALINIGIEDEKEHGLIYPAIYSYRHATELFIKALLPEYKETHDLLKLYLKLKVLLAEKLNAKPPKWFENIIVAFHDFDPSGTSFRYLVEMKDEEMFIDLIHLKKIMHWFSESVHKVKGVLEELEMRNIT